MSLKTLADPAITALKYFDVGGVQVPDSGYVTQSASPDSKPAESFPPESTAVENKARSGPLALNGIAEFDKSVNDQTLSRFRLVQNQIEKPLLRWIRGKTAGGRYQPISLRLMILGRSEDDAKPCIAVFCPEEQCKTIRKFFEKKSILALCRPKDDTTPSFEVFVLGRGLQTKHAENVDIFIPIIGGREGYTDETYCGAPIIIRSPSAVDRRCTFGGIIRAVSWDGYAELYGLTVGHVLFGDTNSELAVASTKDEAEPLDDSELQLSESEDEDEPEMMAVGDFDETEWLPVMDNYELPGGNHDSIASWVSPKVSKIGYISKDSQTHMATPNTIGEDAGAYYDWALIRMEQHKPNRIRPRKLFNGEAQSEEVRSGDLLMPVKPPCSSGKRQPVTLLTGSEGLKKGSLSPLPSRLLLGPGNAFVDTHILTLDGDQQIQDGDSGSWVVNEATLEVYGYVVAADSFGGGYVIPLLQAFLSICDSLDCRSVGLATTVDMATVKLHSDRPAANPQESEEHTGWETVSLDSVAILGTHDSAPSGAEYRTDSGYSSGISSHGVSPSMPIPYMRRNLM